MRLRSYSPVEVLPLPGSRITRFIKMSLKKTMSSPFAPSLADARLAPSPINLTTIVCLVYLHRRRVGQEYSIQILTYCPGRIRERPPAMGIADRKHHIFLRGA